MSVLCRFKDVHVGYICKTFQFLNTKVIRIGQ